MNSRWRSARLEHRQQVFASLVANLEDLLERPLGSTTAAGSGNTDYRLSPPCTGAISE